MGEIRNSYTLEGKRPLGSHRRRWSVILKWILGEENWECGLDYCEIGIEATDGIF
jgi:hypothetical protein